MKNCQKLHNSSGRDLKNVVTIFSFSFSFLCFAVYFLLNMFCVTVKEKIFNTAVTLILPILTVFSGNLPFWAYILPIC